MKTYLTVLFAGAVFASTAFATDGDPLREERFKAKTGRYSSTEETRRLALAPNSGVRKEECTNHECCRHERTAQNHVKATVATGETQSFFDAWSRAKWGRNIRGTNDGSEVQLVLAVPAGDSHAVACDHPKCCD
jgi:hypothetical protein